MTPGRVSSGPSEGSFEELYERAPCGFLSMLTNGTIIKVNRTLLEWIGYSRKQVLGKNLNSFLDKGSQLFYETRYIPVLRLKRDLREVALTLRRADGSLFPILLNSVMVDGQDGGAELIRTAIFDSTERRDYELELLHSRQSAEASEARVRVLQDAASEFVGAYSEIAVAKSLADSARLAFGATEAAVLLFDDVGKLQIVAGRSPIIEVMPLDALRPGPEAIRTGQFIGLANLEEALAFSQQLADALLATRLEAITAVPLIGDSGALGVLTCFFARARRFDDDFSQLQTALARQASQVLSRVALQRQLEHWALHDQLTGLANRVLLQDRMGEALAGAARNGHPLTVLFLDLDGFKAVNDYLGHAVGDSVLKQVSARLQAEVRPSDVVGRFGGDEFIVLAPDTDENAATLMAERIRSSVAKSFDDVLPQFPISVSIGAAVHYESDNPMTADALFTQADEAMYRSKNAGKDCVTLVRI
jgi:diguanylate cyclase (GGDEF)-like protein/PAS domain S-box-containing protein